MAQSTRHMVAREAGAALFQRGLNTYANAVTATVDIVEKQENALDAILEIADKALADDTADRDRALQAIKAHARRVLP